MASFQVIKLKGLQVYKEDGPPLSLGEQLCGRAEPEVLRTLHILHWAHLLSQATTFSILFIKILAFPGVLVRSVLRGCEN
jgi:hypothetical protein